MINFVLAWEIPTESHIYRLIKMKYDVGDNWQLLSSFNQVNYENAENFKNGSFSFKSGFHILNEDLALLLYSSSIIGKNIKSYIYSRVVSRPSAFPRYSGIERDISRFGFQSGETDLAGIMYQDSSFLLKIGRGRESWNSGNGIELIINDESAPFDYGLIGLNKKNFKFRYFHGFLESDTSAVNRYITGKGVEYTNLKNFILSLSETVIYSGQNRPLDFSYFNPMSSHLEIELNDKQNQIGTKSGNAVWQLSLDMLIKNRIRFSSNFLIDELTLDKEEAEEGRKSRVAYSYRICYKNYRSKNFTLTSFLSNVKIGKSTYRHGNGYNNFVFRAKPLGWKYGSDGYELQLGLDALFYNEHFFSFCIGKLQIGNETTLETPYRSFGKYDEYSQLKIESEHIFSKINIRYQVNKKLVIDFSKRIFKPFFNYDNNEFNISIIYF